VIPRVQSKTGKNGRCFSACLASVLELPEAAVPTFMQTAESDFIRAVDRFLLPWGVTYRKTQDTLAKPIGWSTIEGTSPRGGLHACVAFNGSLYWDPHPNDGTGHGLVRPMYYGLLLPGPLAPPWVRRLLIKQPCATAADAVVPPFKPGERIKLANGRWTTVTKVLPAENLFKEREWHVSTATGEVVIVKERD